MNRTNRGVTVPRENPWDDGPAQRTLTPAHTHHVISLAPDPLQPSQGIHTPAQAESRGSPRQGSCSHPCS